MHWRWHVVILHLLCLVACCRYLKAGWHLQGKLLMVHMAWDLCQVLPPRQSLNILSVPLYPHGGMQGEGSGSSGGSSGGGNDSIISDSKMRLSPTLAPARVGSSSPSSHWRWSLSCGEHSRSMSSSSTGVVWASPHHFAWSTISHGVASVGKGKWEPTCVSASHWCSLALCLRLSLGISSASTLPSANVTWCFCLVELGDWVHSWVASLCCEVAQDTFQYLYRLISSVPLQCEVTWEPSGPASVPQWHGVTWELSSFLLAVHRIWTSCSWQSIDGWWSLGRWWGNPSFPFIPQGSQLPQGLIVGHPLVIAIISL